MIFGFSDERIACICLLNLSSVSQTLQELWHVKVDKTMKKIDFSSCLAINISATNRDIATIVRAKLTALYFICAPKIGPVSVTVLTPRGAKTCINLRLLCRYAAMSIYDYVSDSISSSITEISWRYLAVRIRSKCSIRSSNCSLTASTVRTVGGAKISRNCKNISPIQE